MTKKPNIETSNHRLRKLVLVMQAAFFATLYLFCSSFACAEPAPPRLWKAVKVGQNGKATTFYFLASTHVGLPTEFDDYFKNIVLKAYQQANSLAFEGAGGREEEARPTCDPAVLDEKGKQTVAAARKQVTEVFYQGQEINHRNAERAGIHDNTTEHQRRNVAKTYVGLVDEFDLIGLNLLYAQIVLDDTKDSPSISNTQSGSLKGNIVGTLIAERPSIPVQDVDSHYGIHRTYCNAGPNRVIFLESEMHLQNTNAPETIKKIPQLEEDFNTILSGKKSKSDAIDIHLAALDQAFVCQRNKEWEHDIQRIDDGKTYFYVLGARHFFAIDHDTNHCKGLLGDLTDMGMPVQLVK